MKKEIDENNVQQKKENDFLLEAAAVEAAAEAVEDSKSKPIDREGKVIRQVINCFSLPTLPTNY